MPRSQARGAPAAPSPVSRLGSVAKAPATHDGALRAGERAGAFRQPSGVRAAAAVGAHVNSTRVRGGHSTPTCQHPVLVPVPSCTSHPVAWEMSHPWDGSTQLCPPRQVQAKRHAMLCQPQGPWCQPSPALHAARQLCAQTPRKVCGHLVGIPPFPSSAASLCLGHLCAITRCLALGMLQPLPLRAA